MNLTKIDIELNFNQYNGAMTVEIFDRNGVVSLLKDCNGIVKQSHLLDFPNFLKFKLSNKNSKTDTKVVNGEILADKYTQLTSLTVGGIPVDVATLFKICSYEYNQVTAFDTFWAFNGEVTINFQEQDFIYWHLKNNNKFKI